METEKELREQLDAVTAEAFVKMKEIQEAQGRLLLKANKLEKRFVNEMFLTVIAIAGWAAFFFEFFTQHK